MATLPNTAAGTVAADTPLPGGGRPPAPGEAVAWHADGLHNPAAAYYDDGSKAVFVANAGPDGFVSKFAPDGTPLAARWATGLANPGAMRSFKGTLYAACGDHLAVLDVPTAAVTARVPVPGAALAGVAVDAAGIVYLSDPDAGAIHSYDGAAVAVFAAGGDLEHPAGLLVIGNQLFVAGRGTPGSPGRVFALNLRTKQKTVVTPNPVGRLAGLERDERCNFLVADPDAGNVYRVSPKGDVQLLLAGVRSAADDLSAGRRSSAAAGHAYLTDRRLLVLPRPAADAVTAYDLSRLR